MKAEITPGLFRKRYLRAEQRKPRHPSSLGKKKQRAARELWAKINRKISVYVSPVKQIHANALQLIMMHVIEGLRLTKGGRFGWLIKWF